MAVPESNDGGINHRAEVYQQVSQWWECVVFCQGIQRRDEIHITLYLYWLCGFSKSLWLGTNQYCLEDEGVVAGVCDEEDGEGLIFFLYRIKGFRYSPHFHENLLSCPEKSGVT